MPAERDNVNRSAFKKRIFEYRLRVAATAVFAIVAVIVVLFIIWRGYETKVYNTYTVVNAVERIDVEGTKVLGFGSQFITYSADGIHCTDSKGRDVWSFPYQMQSPMVKVSGEYAVCSDYNGQSIYIFNSEGVCGTIQTNSPVKSTQISETGVVAAIIDKGSVTPVNLYYYDGSQIAGFRTTMSKSGYPVAIGISSDSKLVGVSYLYLDSGKLTSKVAFYNFGEVGQNETDNLVSGYDYQDEIIPEIRFLSDKKAFALGSSKLMFYEGSERPINIANILINEEVRAVYSGDNRVGLVFFNTTEEGKYRLDVYTSDGNLENSYYFDLDYSDIFFANDRVVIYNSTSALIYASSGRLKFSGDFNEPVSLVLPTSSSVSYVLVTPYNIETVTLQ